MNRATSLPLSSILRFRLQAWKNLRALPSGNGRYLAFSSSDQGPNPGLASVITQGIKSLEATAADVQSRTRKSLDDTKKSDTTPRRLAEEHRIMEVATDCLEDICMRGGEAGLALSGQPIVILDVQVNRDVKQAKVFWTLPYVVLLDDRINQQVYQKLMMKLQNEIDNGGSGKVLSHHVRTRLSYYYPPRIKLVPATNEMVRNAMEEYLD
jgi:hypothetical protein